MYKVGDLVRVKEHIESDTILRWAKAMDIYKGNTYKVKYKGKTYAGNLYYKLNNAFSKDKAINGDGYWIFFEDWLEDPTEDINIEESEFMSMFK